VLRSLSLRASVSEGFEVEAGQLRRDGVALRIAGTDLVCNKATPATLVSVADRKGDLCIQCPANPLEHLIRCREVEEWGGVDRTVKNEVAIGVPFESQGKCRKRDVHRPKLRLGDRDANELNDLSEESLWLYPQKFVGQHLYALDPEKVLIAVDEAMVLQKLESELRHPVPVAGRSEILPQRGRSTPSDVFLVDREEHAGLLPDDHKDPGVRKHSGEPVGDKFNIVASEVRFPGEAFGGKYGNEPLGLRLAYSPLHLLADPLWPEIEGIDRNKALRAAYLRETCLRITENLPLEPARARLMVTDVK
jgi:hypothetical protein